PGNFWAHFYTGVSAYRTRRHPDAVIAFSVCAGLRPTVANCYFNRAQVEAELGWPAQALVDYDRAISLRPDFAAALLNRGTLHYRQGRLERALADYRDALQHGAATTTYYNIALVQEARNDIRGAMASLDRALDRDPHFSDARDLYEKLRLLTKKP